MFNGSLNVFERRLPNFRDEIKKMILEALASCSLLKMPSKTGTPSNSSPYSKRWWIQDKSNKNFSDPLVNPDLKKCKSEISTPPLNNGSSDLILNLSITNQNQGSKKRVSQIVYHSAYSDIVLDYI